MKKCILFLLFLFILSCDKFNDENLSSNEKVLLEEYQKMEESDETITVKDDDLTSEYFVETDTNKISELLSKTLGISLEEIKLSDTVLKFPIAENENTSNEMVKMLSFKYKNFYIHFELNDSDYVTCYAIAADKSKVSYNEFQKMIEKFVLIGVDEENNIEPKVIVTKLFAKNHSEISYENNLYLFLENDSYNFAVIKIPNGVERINPIK